MILTVLYSILFFFSNALGSTNDGGQKNFPKAKPGREIAGRYIIIKKINFSGNKKTRQSVIERELLFSENDTISFDDLTKVTEQSKANILNTSLFNFVDIITTMLDSSTINIAISVSERWYTWPVPILEIAERNYNSWLVSKNHLSRANYGFYINKDNFRGRKELLSIKVRMGYSEQYGFSYQIPYINKYQNSGLGFSSYFSRNHEIAYGSFNNNLLYYKNPNMYVRSGFSSTLKYTFRQGIYIMHTAELGYVKDIIADTISFLNREYFRKNRTSTEYLLLNYVFKRDCRDSKAYPLKGYYFGFQTIKYGLGILKHENTNALFIESVFNKFWHLNNRFYSAASVKGRISLLPQQPYFLQKAFGYTDFVRGYEYYVIEGESYGLVKTSLKYQLLKPRIEKIPFLTIEKFDTFHYALYAGVFADMGYVKNKFNYQNNNLTNSFLTGFGVGLDFVTYYDITFRIEYSFNKIWENDFFPHFGPGI